MTCWVECWEAVEEGESRTKNSERNGSAFPRLAGGQLAVPSPLRHSDRSLGKKRPTARTLCLSPPHLTLHRVLLAVDPTSRPFLLAHASQVAASSLVSGVDVADSQPYAGPLSPR